MIRRYLDIQRGVLRVTAERENLAATFAGMVGDALPASAEAPCYGVEIREGTPETELPEAELIYSGPVYEEGNCILVQRGSKRLLSFPDHVSLTLDADARSARMIVAPGHENRIRMTAGLTALQAAVGVTGQSMLHAAGLTIPGRDEIVLVFGESGAGKTTTALALCAAGFGLCSDDCMIFSTGAQSAEAWGLPRGLKVHRRTAEMLDWVEPLLSGQWSAENEKALRLADLKASMTVAPQVSRPVAGLFKLERGTSGSSRSEPMEKTDALSFLASDHVRIGRTGLLDSDAASFRALAALARSAPVYRLVAGGDLASIAPAMLDALGSNEACRG